MQQILKIYMKNLDNCAFLPLDIDVGPIDFDLLEAYHEDLSNRPKHDIGENTHGVYAFGISPVLFRGTLDQFLNQEYCDNNFINRYVIGETPKYLLDFDKKFPSIVGALEQLPITITHVEMLSNKKDAPAHFDDWEVDGEVDPMWSIFWTRTPEQTAQIPDATLPLSSYKMFIYEHPADSFFVSDSVIGEPVFGNFNQQAYVAGISKTKYPHGAVRVPGLRKYVVSVWGLLDKERHLELLEQSYARNKEYGIFF